MPGIYIFKIRMLQYGQWLAGLWRHIDVTMVTHHEHHYS